MMSGILDPGEDQDLGQDFHFESDPLALESILNHRGLNPGSLQPQKSDYEGLKNRLAKVQDKFDFFEGKNGMMFYRPSAKFNREEMPDAADGQQSQGFRAMRAMKSKGIQKDSFKPRRSLMRTPGASAKKPERPPKSRTKTPNSHVFKVPSVVQTEKKLLPFVPAPHRQSISERKPLVPRNINAGGGIKKSLVPTAKKTLDFREEPSKDADENNVKEDSFEFARPLNPSQFPTPSPPAKSKVELILMREGLVGLPRESMSFLLRQSLSKVELDRMFEDDSTESFEALERRLKTPKKSLGRMSMSKNGAVKKSSVTVAADMLNDDLAKKEEEEDWAVDRKLSMIAKKGKMRAAEIKMAKSDPEEIEPVIVEESASNEREKSAETAPCQSETISEEQKAECVEEEDAEGEVEAPADDGLDDDDDLETDADYEVSFLRRSASMLDISSSAGEESLKKTNLEDKKENEKKMADTTAPLQLARSVSEADLSRRIDSAPQPVSQFLLDALEAHRQHLEEQEEIERQMLALMSKAKSRREEFRKTWGVSPKSINRKRTIKTVQTEEMEVNFSPARTTTDQDIFVPQSLPNAIFHTLEESATANDLDRSEEEQISEDYNEQEMDMTGVVDFGPGETSRPPEGGADENQEKVATRPHGKVKKSVRFLNATPQDRRQEEDHPEEVGDEDEEAAEQESHRIDVNIPTRSGSISFNETGARRGLMQTPGKVNRSAATNNLPPMTTPMALRAISSKAQAELALLYADGDEFQEEDADEQVSAEYSEEEEVEEEEENEITFKRGVKLNFDEVDD